MITYSGQSMNPTLKTADLLYVLPYRKQKFQPGDVVVFYPSADRRLFTHRIVRIDSQGIRTRGDNNNNLDSWILSSDHIIGRVVYAQRKKRRLPIYGGLRGRLYILRIRTQRMIDSKVSNLLRPLYYRLARADLFRRFLPPKLRMRILSFNRPKGTEFQLVMGRFVIGRLLPNQERWSIRRPFKLFVNEETLPHFQGEKKRESL